MDWFCVAQVLLRRLEMADSDSVDVARAKFVQVLAPWLAQPNDPAPELLGQIIGLDFSAAPAVVRLGTDTRLLYDRALTALRLWLERPAASDSSPVVVVVVLLLLDDLHWADDASLDALSKLLKDFQGPVLALLRRAAGPAGAPAGLGRCADWVGDRSRPNSVIRPHGALPRLPPQESRENASAGLRIVPSSANFLWLDLLLHHASARSAGARRLSPRRFAGGDEPAAKSLTVVSSPPRCGTSGGRDRCTMGRTRVYTTG